ncbi:hypothetical protein Ait01nite_043350 [Actinoplanes italicus]|nr:hypothetical protein Ait01nite_043350 [Actinoplanes italicus]
MTDGQRGDSPQFIPVLPHPRTRCPRTQPARPDHPAAPHAPNRPGPIAQQNPAHPSQADPIAQRCPAHPSLAGKQPYHGAALGKQPTMIVQHRETAVIPHASRRPRPPDT